MSMLNIKLSDAEESYVRGKAEQWDMSLNAVVRKMVRLGSLIEGKIADGCPIGYKNKSGEWVQLVPLDLGPRLMPYPVEEIPPGNEEEAERILDSLGIKKVSATTKEEA